ncbi:carbohydrate kinase [Microbacterium betulae]|uniref:Carbohydrate kinase n=1 Tax=Microbacterium betulae TaxID=2981139 RepID=A0AA97FFP4_9MICO|nr:carbohydrate kinase [Microbacterium sp. AB]WOF21783.1 carbohydrate kinase [Microbacterium sp. AB]
MSGARPAVLVVGEALVDIVHRADGTISESPGGSPANVAITLGRLGRSPGFIARLADDERGRAVRAWLEDSGVSIDATAAERTSTATAHLDAEGAARYDFAIEWDVVPGTGTSADVLHTGSIAALLAPGADAVSALVDEVGPRALVTYDPNIRPSLIDDPDDARRRVRSFIARADVVKASDEDIAWLHPGEDPVAVAAQWTQSGPVLVVVTQGADGAFAAGAGRFVRVEAEPVDVVDTVGAGDTFMGTLIDGLVSAGAVGPGARDAVGALGDDELAALITRSARAAAITVSRPGADPPTRAELDARLVG